MATFGEELRRERELRQISLREVSEATKINMRFLEALERNEFRHLPGGQFTKGFVRAYSQHIGLDAEENAQPALDRGVVPARPWAFPSWPPRSRGSPPGAADRSCWGRFSC